MGDASVSHQPIHASFLGDSQVSLPPSKVLKVLLMYVTT